MDQRTTARLLASAVLGVGAAGMADVVLPDSILNRALQAGVILIIVSLVAYRLIARRFDDRG